MDSEGMLPRRKEWKKKQKQKQIVKTRNSSDYCFVYLGFVRWDFFRASLSLSPGTSMAW